MTSAAFTVHSTPVGDALVVVTEDGLVSLDVLDGPHDDALAQVSLALRTVPVPDEAATAPVMAQLDEYFAGQRRRFDVAIDWRLTHGFARAALQAVCEIPYGETASYAEVAISAGSPGANRAVGSACARTPLSLVVPVHRVVRADGSIGEYGGRPDRKRFLLDLESVGAGS
jgi:methylated-DNA-[protein]-cysteine S-methyltransferase